MRRKPTLVRRKKSASRASTSRDVRQDKVSTVEDFLSMLDLPDEEKNHLKAALCGEKGSYKPDDPIRESFFCMTSDDLKEIGVKTVKIRSEILHKLKIFQGRLFFCQYSIIIKLLDRDYSHLIFGSSMIH